MPSLWPSSSVNLKRNRYCTPGISCGLDPAIGANLNFLAVRTTERSNTVTGSASTTFTESSSTSPLVSTVNSTSAHPSIPAKAALVGYWGATATIGKISPLPSPFASGDGREADSVVMSCALVQVARIISARAARGIANKRWVVALAILFSRMRWIRMLNVLLSSINWANISGALSPFISCAILKSVSA